jgi:hypothetical protein
VDHSSVVVQSANGTRSFVTRQIAGETLIVPVTGHVTNLDSIYVLNEVASRVWTLLQSPTTADRIAEALASEFDIAPDRAAEDVGEFLDALVTRGLIHVAEGT